TATITGTTGGTFTISSPGVINSTTGEINLSTSGVGSFTVTYNTNSSGNSCPVKDSTIITITNSPKADFSYDAIQSCQSAVNPILTLASGSVAGIFTSSPSGLTLDSTNGNINLSSSVAGSYTVYNTVVASGGCAGVKDSTIITVKASYQLNETVSICKGSSYTFPDGTMQANIISSTTHTSNLLSITGCDSVISTQVTIKFSYLIQESVNVCSGGNYTFADGSTVNNITTTIMHNSNLSTTLGCDSIIETTVLATPNNTISVNAIASLCNPSQITLTANGSGNGVVTWYSDRSGTTVLGTGSPLNIPATSSGTFTYYTNEAGSCASNIDSVSVTVSLVHAAITATPTEGMAPLEVAFGNQSSTGSNITYLWEFEEEHNSNLFEPSYTFNENGTYQVILTVSDGNCKDTAMVTVKAIGKSDLDIPNIFSPNGDGRNDVFSMIGKNLAEIKGEIYNRWGQKLYEWDSPHTSWDGRTLSGTEAPQGIYYYIIEAKGFDNVKYNKTGAVTLVR
ncbi:MAG: gliding motility-associated C-terminal domain-containing protein, partial [Bacteroidia bacterium]|nr:gliding motility-associated C-terminal domain-containing protein [Bacteroidia bacterium]